MSRDKCAKVLKRLAERVKISGAGEQRREQESDRIPHPSPLFQPPDLTEPPGRRTVISLNDMSQARQLSSGGRERRRANGTGAVRLRKRLACMPLCSLCYPPFLP
ncbi:unnamed protein product [Rangifer tarandus platyrhynchus]|uniref:Uncharacterized protein n=1 Tax=Rangifer tarandus platyrhynchus TaxID=3082113 RepID=A0AC60A5G3_RANTA